MRFYLFNSVGKKYAVPFKLFVINQNIKVARFSSLLVSVICLAILVSGLAFDLSFIPSSRHYLYCYAVLLAASVGYYLAISYIKKIPSRKRINTKRILANSYPLIIILGLMWISYASEQSPANNMTMFMFGMLFVAVSWLFNIRSAIITGAFTFLALVIGLSIFKTSQASFVVNLLAGGIIILGFYIISRILYSYHANYFIQLKIIERNNHEIKKIAQLRTEMLGIVAHDLRSPINSVTALVDLARITETQEERHEYYDMIDTACNEAQSIIRDLITIVKGESIQNLQLKNTDINTLLKDIAQHWSLQMPDNKTIEAHLPDDTVVLSIDQEKIFRVFDNLVNNAIKFTNPGGKIELGVTMNESQAVITVTDNGIGIPEDIKPYLFDRFSKAGRLGLKGEKSHGLGLNICKLIIEQHGGTIAVDSEVGRGTRFTISLPLVLLAEDTDIEEREITGTIIG